MRVIAVIDDPRLVEKILRHLGAWHDPPAGLSPPGAPGPFTCEPCDDAGPMPDYEDSVVQTGASILCRPVSPLAPGRKLGPHAARWPAPANSAQRNPVVCDSSQIGA